MTCAEGLAPKVAHQARHARVCGRKTMREGSKPEGPKQAERAGSAYESLVREADALRFT